jgi:hypothetical protein
VNPAQFGDAQKGFGARVMEKMIIGQLRGEICFVWHAQGLACGITIPA